MTELKIILGELNESLREYLESGHAKKTEELSKVCYLADMFEKARGVPGPVSFNRQQARRAWEISLRLKEQGPRLGVPQTITKGWRKTLPIWRSWKSKSERRVRLWQARQLFTQPAWNNL
jgi:hypothetical protein